MNRNSIGIIVLLIVIGGGWFMLSGTPAKAPAPETPATNQMPVTGNATPEMIVENTAPGVTIMYTDRGFSPSNISVPLGTSVTFVNQSTEGMWVASAMHPTHAVYGGTSLSQHCPDTTNSSFDACASIASGNSFSFTFNKEGIWKYHDHLSASKFGTVIVTAAP